MFIKTRLTLLWGLFCLLIGIMSASSSFATSYFRYQLRGQLHYLSCESSCRHCGLQEIPNNIVWKIWPLPPGHVWSPANLFPTQPETLWRGFVPAGPSQAEITRKIELERQIELEKQRQAEIRRQNEIKRQLELGRQSDLTFKVKAAEQSAKLFAETQERQAQIEATRDEQFEQIKSEVNDRVRRTRAMADTLTALLESSDFFMQDETNFGGPTDQSQRVESGPSTTQDDHQCFVAGSQILTSNEKNPLKPIQSIKEGDEVWSCNTAEDQCVIRKVKSTSSTEINELVEIHVRGPNGGETTLQTTPKHPFYKEGQTLPALARDLKEGDALWGYKDPVIVTQVERKTLNSPVLVFNFQVEALEGNNNYFVGEHLILVHNCNILEGAGAVSNVAGPLCAVTAAACAAGLGATAATGVMLVPSGGAVAAVLPVVGSVTIESCEAAAVSCTAAVGASAVQNALSTGRGSGDEDSAGQQPKAQPKKPGKKADKQKNGTPGNNQAQNKQVNDIVRDLKLTYEQRETLHDLISGRNLGYSEILEIAKEVKEGLR